MRPSGHKPLSRRYHDDARGTIAHIQAVLVCKVGPSRAFPRIHERFKGDLARLEEAGINWSHRERLLLDFVVYQHCKLLSQNSDAVAIERSSDGQDSALHLLLKAGATEGSSCLQVVPYIHPLSFRGFFSA